MQEFPEQIATLIYQHSDPDLCGSTLLRLQP
jgi:hypothetical protein